MTYAEIYQLASVGTAREIENGKNIIILNLAQEKIWEAFPWRWTLEDLSPFWLTSYESDYGAPLVVIPSDFLELHRAVLVRLNSYVSNRAPLQIQKEFDKDSRVGTPDTICYVPSKNVFRVHPRPSDGHTCPFYLIEGVYKKTPTEITTSNYQTSSLPSMTHQKSMWIAAINWAYYEITKDFERSNVSFQKMQMAIRQAANTEATSLGEPNVHPFEGLAT